MILTKILALQLEQVAPTIISPDQTGFIKKHFPFSNVRQLLNILYNKHWSDSLIRRWKSIWSGGVGPSLWDLKAILLWPQIDHLD